MSTLVGFALALLIGVTLGMLGGGGSILTVPVFVYVMGLDAKAAIAASLPVVGATSLIAAVGHWRSQNVDGAVVAVFGPLAMLGAWVGARLAALVSGAFQLTLLGAVMAVAGTLMLGGREPVGALHDRAGAPSAPRWLLLGGTGLLVGLLTGLVGVGGGFMIVPALVLLAGVPMKRAVGTSLLVISLSTLTGLAGYRGQTVIPWNVVGGFAALMTAGALAGTRAARRVPGHLLRRAFGVLVLALAAFLLYENLAGRRGVDATPAARKP